ncbi:MAG: energy transducer TonB [Cyclobacteriaceae bacterium]|nr:energy transducer TonB [Cyclobacteriaceae bacterium]
MEPKKTEKADLERKTGLYFNVGLVVTMAVIVLAFDWRSYDRDDVVLQGQVTEIVEDLLDIPPTEQPPPPPPKIQQPEIIEVPDEEEIEEEIEVDLDIEITEEEVIEEIVFEEVEEEVADEIFTIVEDPAAPDGGLKAFYDYVAKKMKYPSQARRMGIEGRVFVEFVVDKDGSLINVKAIKGIGAGCDEEAVRVIKMHPKWKPGKQRGKAVKQKIVMPINFQLG